jgi:hypothetical protein
VQRNGLAMRYVQASLKTNVEALAKLYTTSEEQLMSDLRLLQIHVDVIEEVICYLKASIATSSIMIEQFRSNVIADDLLPTIQGYVYTPHIPGNDEKEIKDFSLS